MSASCIPADLSPVLLEEPRQYFLQIELPGLAKHQIGVLVEEGLLTITRGDPHSQPSDEMVMSRMRMPADVEPSSVVADFRAGVLRVRLPRSLPARSWWRR